MSRRGSQAGRAAGPVLGALLLLGSCSEPIPLPERPTSPPLGPWNFVELTGSVETLSGGTPVLCPEGRITRWPQTLSPKYATLSHLELEPRGRLRFRLAFEADRTEPGEEATGFLLLGHEATVDEAQAPPGIDLIRRRGQAFARWTWPEGAIEGRFEAGEALGDGSRPSRLVLRFEGRFEGPLEMSGSWSLREERFETGDCWSRSSGSGTWRAVPEAPVDQSMRSSGSRFSTERAAPSGESPRTSIR
jgi:hypothetical protein